MRQKWRDDAQLYLIEFKLGGGHTTFGFFGTLKQWDGKMEDFYQEADAVEIVKKEYKCNGKEQREFSLQSAEEFKKSYLHKPNETAKLYSS